MIEDLKWLKEIHGNYLSAFFAYVYNKVERRILYGKGVKISSTTTQAKQRNK